MLNCIIYVIVLILFFVIVFKLLCASRLEECFKQGRVTEIKIAYVLISLIVSFLLCELIDKFLSFYGIAL